MKEVLKFVSVSDYPKFKEMVMEVTKWSRTQYNDRKTGRIKISHVERQVLRGIAEQIKKEGGAS